MPYYNMPDGEKLFVREIGQGEPVLVLSGLGMQSWQWIPFLLPNQKYKFIIPDWRGFGGSNRCAIPEMDAISSHWRDIDSLITQLELPSFAVIAYSMGATTAMHGMQYGDFGDKISHYLHIDQTPKIRVDETWNYGLFGKKQFEFRHLLKEISQLLNAHTDKKLLKELDDTDRRSLVELWLDFIKLQASNKVAPYLFGIALNRPKLQPYILPVQRLDYLKWYVNNYLHHNEDYRSAISTLTCPTTFFTGQESVLYPAKGQKIIADSMLNARQVIFKKSGHTPLITEPVKFRFEISRFLKSIA